VEGFNHIVEATNDKVDLSLCIEKFIDKLYNMIVIESSYHMIKFGKALSPEIMAGFKKVLIYLRERGEILEKSIEQLKLIIVQAFTVVPKPEVFVEFFALLREIFYYIDDVQDVDFKLAGDVMDVFRKTMEAEPSILADYYWFSEQSPGVVVSTQLKFQNSFLMSLKFRLSLEQHNAFFKKQRTGSQSEQIVPPKPIVPPKHQMFLLGLYPQNTSPLEFSIESKHHYFQLMNLEEHQFDLDEWHTLTIWMH